MASYRFGASLAATTWLLALGAASPVQAVTYYAANKLNGGTAAQSNQVYSATDEDTSAIWVTNAGILTLDNCEITTSGNTSSQDNSSYYGLNAGVLAAIGTINLSNCMIVTSGTGANGVFATGSGSSITMSNCAIEATANGAHAVMATRGGSLTLANVDMSTAGANAGAIATDRGGGTIDVTGGTVTTSGQDSPGIYSTGEITVFGAAITAGGSEAAVIEGANSISLTNTDLSSSEEDKWGVLIYQSTSGDASGTEGVFTMTGGSLANTASSGPLFFVTNSTGIISLTGVEVTATSGTLVEAGATSRWGTSGSNGGTVDFTASGETLAGNIVTDDSISSIAIKLKNGTTLTGAIDTAALSLDATSTWTVTATSYLSSLSDSSGISGTSITNIIGNGNDVYYDSSLSANSALGGDTYSLVNGGQLIPQSGSSLSQAITSGLTSLCGVGAVGVMPLVALGLAGMRTGVRRLRPRSAA